jgi:hypothetical protein
MVPTLRRSPFRRLGWVSEEGVDGEVAIFDKQLRSRFEWLQEPDPEAVASPPPSGLTTWPVALTESSRCAGSRRLPPTGDAEKSRDSIRLE